MPKVIVVVVVVTTTRVVVVVWCSGAGYIVSYDLAKYLADPPIPLRRWTHEDVGVGSWLMAVE